jgi:hypothetical protein
MVAFFLLLYHQLRLCFLYTENQYGSLERSTKLIRKKKKKHSFVNIYLQGERQLSIHFIILYRTGLSAINAHNTLKIIMREIYDYTQLSIVICWLFAEIISFNLRM